MDKAQSRKTISLYLLFLLLSSTVVWVLTLHATNAGRIAGRIYGYGIMWCPALATLITLKLTGRKISDLAWKWGDSKYMRACYVIPILYALISYLIIWLTGWGGFYDKGFITGVQHELGWNALPTYLFIILFFIVNGVIGMFGSMSTALGEEIGWRGLLVPELSNLMSYTKVSLTSGLIWAVWHYPVLIFGHYNNGTPAWYGVFCFTIMVISISFIFTWFRLKSGSLWTGVMLHASHNLFIQSFFTPITLNTGHTNWYTDEFGAVLPTVTVLFAVYFWTRRGELDQQRSQPTR